jgi:hypothetical protein
METKITENIETLFKSAGEYLETRIDLYQLKAVDKSSDVLSSIVSKMIIFLIFIMFVFIINIGIALWIGELLGKAYYGFFVLAGFYLIAGLIFNANRKKWFKEPLANKLIKQFLK